MITSQEPAQELSEREIEILKLVATGATNQQIAQALYISPNTVKTHLRNIFAKLGVESRTEATLYAIQHGLIAVPSPVAEPEAEPLTPEEIATRFWGSREPSRSITWRQAFILLVALLFAGVMVFWPFSDLVTSSRALPSRLYDVPIVLRQKGHVEVVSRWKDHATMPVPVARFALAEVDGMVYTIGGATQEGITGAVNVYDPLRDTWEHRASKPTAVANVGAVTIDGRIYVPGGLGQNGKPLATLEIYNPQTDTWEKGAPLPVPLCAYAIAPYGQGFYLFGGWNGERYLDTVYYYDAPSGTWTLEARMPWATTFASAALARERIYLTGGYDGNAESPRCVSYDPALARAGRDPWQSLPPMLVGRAGHAMVEVLGNLYVLGGGWEQPLVHNERYDIAHERWTTFESPILGEWRNLGAVRIETSAGAFIYAMGGWSKGYLDVVKAYQAFYRIYLP